MSHQLTEDKILAALQTELRPELQAACPSIFTIRRWLRENCPSLDKQVKFTGAPDQLRRIKEGYAAITAQQFEEDGEVYVLNRKALEMLGTIFQPGGKKIKEGTPYSVRRQLLRKLKTYWTLVDDNKPCLREDLGLDPDKTPPLSRMKYGREWLCKTCLDFLVRWHDMPEAIAASPTTHAWTSRPRPR
jgi:hypothetical protein